MEYGLFGPFNNGASPGISAAFLNALETFLLSLKPATASVNGQTSGTATLYEYVFGITTKKVVINLVNYRNSSAQNLVLPTAFTSKAAIDVKETQGMQIALLLSSSAQTIHVQTAQGLSGGTQSSQSFIKQWSVGQTDTGFDTVQLGTGAGSASNGLIIIEGV
jgi:hypothetical protein